MSNLLLRLEYDGSGFHGWQRQPGGDVRTVAGELARAIETVTGESPRLLAAGRTDAGAHSLGQAVNFALASDVEPDRLRGSLNGVLPADITVLSAAEVPAEFHARFSARRRHYRYLVENRDSRPALLRGRAWHVRRPLDLVAMRAAAKELLGRHDLRAFGSDPAGRNTIRNLESIRLRRMGNGVDGVLLAFELSADAFLYGMVRRIVGFLVEIGMGRRSVAGAAEALHSGQVKQAALMAPAHGLYQLRVDY